MTVTIEQLYEQVVKLRDDLAAQLELRKIIGKQIEVPEGLSGISKTLGLIRAGEFRAGNGNDPGQGFTGVRMGYPAFEYASELWHLVGIANDVLQFGLSADTGKAFFGGGVDIIDEFGIHVYDAGGKPAFIALSAAETINSEALGAGDVMIGDNSSGKANLLWDQSASQLKFRIGTVLSSYLATAGLTQVAAKANLPNASKQSIATATLTTISFTQEEYDDDTFISLGTDDTKITIPTGQGGVYSVGSNLAWDGNATGLRAVGIYINGAGAPFVASQVLPPGANTCTLNFTEDQTFSAGDYIQMKVTQNSGGNLSCWGNLYMRKIR